ncbi:MAG: hypothetical protein E4H09_03900, partial [Spirochaetales bacterium]
MGERVTGMGISVDGQMYEKHETPWRWGRDILCVNLAQETFPLVSKLPARPVQPRKERGEWLTIETYFDLENLRDDYRTNEKEQDESSPETDRVGLPGNTYTVSLTRHKGLVRVRLADSLGFLPGTSCRVGSEMVRLLVELDGIDPSRARYFLGSVAGTDLTGSSGVAALVASAHGYASQVSV